MKSKKVLITLLTTLAIFSFTSIFIYFSMDKMFSKDFTRLVTMNEGKSKENTEVKKDVKETKKTEIDKNKKLKIIKEAQEQFILFTLKNHKD